MSDDDGYHLSEDPALLDLGLVHSWLSEDAYWALGRDRDLVERSFAGSAAAGVYTDGGLQVAVARIVTDRATFAWLCDVYVDRAHRGRGIGHQLARWAVGWATGHGIKRLLLATRDAHEVYAAAGFVPLDVPGRWMEIDLRTA